MSLEDRDRQDSGMGKMRPLRDVYNDLLDLIGGSRAGIVVLGLIGSMGVSVSCDRPTIFSDMLATKPSDSWDVPSQPSVPQDPHYSPYRPEEDARDVYFEQAARDAQVYAKQSILRIPPSYVPSQTFVLPVSNEGGGSKIDMQGISQPQEK